MALRSLLVSTFVATLTFTNAQAEPQKHHEHTASQHHPAKSNNATRAYEAAMQKMHANMNAPLSGDADVDFVRQMIPHHQGAVAMAKIQRQYGRDEKLKRFNAWVIQAQEQEIGMMKNWLYRRDNGAAAKGAKDYYGEAMTTMHHAMMVDYTGDADIDYARGMIAHHQGAVDMASILMSEGSDPEITALARDIYNSQTHEIAWLERWLEQHTKTR